MNHNKNKNRQRIFIHADIMTVLKIGRWDLTVSYSILNCIRVFTIYFL